MNVTDRQTDRQDCCDNTAFRTKVHRTIKMHDLLELVKIVYLLELGYFLENTEESESESRSRNNCIKKEVIE